MALLTVLAGGDVGVLEVTESEFTKDITEMVAAEQRAAGTYEEEKFDSASARSEKPKVEVATLQEELADLARPTAEMDKIHADEKSAFEKNHLEREQGSKGVKLALKILNDY